VVDRRDEAMCREHRRLAGRALDAEGERFAIAPVRDAECRGGHTSPYQ